MLLIEKKKLRLSNILVWGGSLIILISPVTSLWGVEKTYWLAGIIAGGIIGVAGGIMKNRLFRCPKCGDNVLDIRRQMGGLFNKTVEFCPKCGERIEVYYKD